MNKAKILIITWGLQKEGKRNKVNYVILRRLFMVALVHGSEQRSGGDFTTSSRYCSQQEYAEFDKKYLKV